MSGMRATSRGRRLAVAALLVLGGLAVMAAGVATWVRGVVLDRDAFVDALRPLADDEDLREGLVVELTDRVLSLQPVADRDDGELAVLIEDALDTVLTGPLFETIWTGAARLAHDQVERAVRDGGRRVELDLGELLVRVDDLLETGGRDVLDDEQIERIDDVVVTRGGQVAHVVDVLHAVERLAVVLPFVALALLGGAVALARRRSVAIALVGAVLALAGGGTLAAAALARGWAVGRVEAGARRSAVSDVADGLFGPLHRQSWILLAIGVAVAVGGGVAHLASRSDVEET